MNLTSKSGHNCLSHSNREGPCHFECTAEWIRNDRPQTRHRIGIGARTRGPRTPMFHVPALASCQCHSFGTDNTLYMSSISSRKDSQTNSPSFGLKLYRTWYSTRKKKRVEPIAVQTEPRAIQNGMNPSIFRRISKSIHRNRPRQGYGSGSCGSETGQGQENLRECHPANLANVASVLRRLAALIFVPSVTMSLTKMRNFRHK